MIHPRVFLVPVSAQIAVCAAVAVSAAWKGGWRERLIAILFLLPLPLYALFPLPPHGPLLSPTKGWRALVDDLALLAACLVSLRGASRYWVVLASALALLEVISDAALLLDPDVTLIASASANLIWSWLLAAAIVWASLTRHRRPAAAAA